MSTGISSKIIDHYNQHDLNIQNMMFNGCISNILVCKSEIYETLDPNIIDFP